MLRRSKKVSLEGGFPWGFRLHEDRCGIQVQRVRADGKAAAAGVQEGDLILSINGKDCRKCSLKDVNYLIDQCFDKLELGLEMQHLSLPTCNSPYVSSHLRWDKDDDSIKNTYNRLNSTHSQKPLSTFVKASDANYQHRKTNMLSCYMNPSSSPSRRDAQFPVRSNIISSLQSATSGNQKIASFRRPSVRGCSSDMEDWQRVELRVPAKVRLAPIKRSAGHVLSGMEHQPSQPRQIDLDLTTRQRFYLLRRPSLDKNIEHSTPFEGQDVQLRKESSINPRTRFRETSFCQGPQTNPNTHASYYTDSDLDQNILGESLRVVSKSQYASLSRGGYPEQYPTIEERKLIARHIASTLEKGFALPKVRRESSADTEANPRAELPIHKLPNGEFPSSFPQNRYVSSTQQEIQSGSKMNNAFKWIPEGDVLHIGSGRIPKMVLDSVMRMNHNQAIRNVMTPPQFQHQHQGEHATHIEAYATSPSPALNAPDKRLYGSSRVDKGTELFQRRKARCQRWIVEGKKSTRMAYHSDTETLLSPASITTKDRRINFEMPTRMRTQHFDVAPRNWIANLCEIQTFLSRYSISVIGKVS